ncbi:MAG: hypothetical protein Q9164_005965 [Protoblastenia rupestris]
MTFDNLPTEIVAEILSCTVQEWLQGLSEHNTPEPKVITQHGAVNDQWRTLLIEKLTRAISSIEDEGEYFNAIMSAARYGTMEVLYAAFSAGNVHLLDTEYKHRWKSVRPVALKLLALTQAAVEDQVTVFSYLLQKITVDETTQANYLRCCIGIGSVKSARLLLERGTSLEIDFSTLPQSENQAIESLRLLQEFGIDFRNMPCKQNREWLDISAERGQTKVVQFLLDEGCDVNKSGDFVVPETPLSLSCENRHLEVVRLLLQRGAALDCAYPVKPPSRILPNETTIDIIGITVMGRGEHKNSCLYWKKFWSC